MLAVFAYCHYIWSFRTNKILLTLNARVSFYVYSFMIIRCCSMHQTPRPISPFEYKEQCKKKRLLFKRKYTLFFLKRNLCQPLPTPAFRVRKKWSQVHFESKDSLSFVFTSQWEREVGFSVSVCFHYSFVWTNSWHGFWLRCFVLIPYVHCKRPLLRKKRAEYVLESSETNNYRNYRDAIFRNWQFCL